MLIEALPWDTGFFGLQIGVIRAGRFEPEAFRSERQAYDLVYIYAHPEDGTLESIESVCGSPADTRVIYIKAVDPQASLPDGITSFTETKPDDQLLALAWQSGQYSRFHTDPRFPRDAFRRLYTEWINRSVDRSRALEVLVFRDRSGQILGFVTLEAKQGDAHIGLIAVSDLARGQGIGTMLIQAAEYEALRRNFLYLKVATQSVNREACGLYEKCGFAVDEVMHVYHYWKT